jgi:hypothetical protein
MIYNVRVKNSQCDENHNAYKIHTICFYSFILEQKYDLFIIFDTYPAI